MTTQDSELLLRIISDEDEAWQRVCADVRECVRLDCAVAPEPDESALEFLRQNDRRVVEGAARRLLSLGQRRRVLDALLQRISEIILLSGWMSRTEVGPVAAVAHVFRRACDVSRWLLNLKWRELKSLDINPIALARQITELEADPTNAEVRKPIRVALELLHNCLPLSKADVAENLHRLAIRPPLRPIPELHAEYVLLIGGTGYRIVDEHGVTRHRASLPPRLQRLLAACWAYCWTKQQCGPGGAAVNEAILGELDLCRLRELIGKTANRANVAELRRYMAMDGGNSVLGAGKKRMFLVDIALDVPSDLPVGSFRKQATVFLRNHDIVIPEGFLPAS
ncbi:MAG TPA: hypothetical protein VGP72_06840 [Planctomycetota bacterium]